MPLFSHVDSDIRHTDAFDESRSRLRNSLLKGLSILGTPILFVSLYRFYQFGWQPIGAIQVLAVAALISGAILNNRLPLWVRSPICIGTVGFVGVSGIFAFGVTASSGVYIPFASVFAALLHNQRSGILVLSFLTLVTSAIEGLYLSGLLNIGPEVYGVWLNPVEWIIRQGSWFMLALAAILGIGMITTDAANTLEQLSEQKVVLESSQRQYQGFFENAVDIVFRTDTDGKFIDYHRRSLICWALSPKNY